MIVNGLKKVLICILVMLPCSALAAKHLPVFVYKQLTQVHLLMETESWSEASELLRSLAKKTKSKYALALIAKSQGQIAIHQDDLSSALVQFKKALAPQVLEEPENKQLLHSVAQLHCAVEEWRDCRAKMRKWTLMSPEHVKANDYMLITQAFAATDDWLDVIEPANQALKLNFNAPKAWFQMPVAAYVNLDNWPAAINAQERLLGKFSLDSDSWRRLTALHINNEDYQGALDSMRLPFEKGLLDRESDVLQMAQLFFHAGLPYQAAISMQKGLDNGWLPETTKNLEYLAGYWLEAKSFSKAIYVYHQLVDISPKRQWYRQLATLYFQQTDWASALKVLRQISTQESPDEMNLLLGLTLINIDEFEEATEILKELRHHEKLKPQAENWLKYVEQFTG
jgi:tetratricopeptide (TPR) repeat protein